MWIGRRKAEIPSRVLIVIAQSGMGDAVEALPAFELIRDYWPSVHLGVGYFKDKQRVVLEASPCVSELVRLHGSVRYAWRAMKALFLNLKAMRDYDTVLFLYKKDVIAWPMTLAAKLAGARVLYQRDYRYRDSRRNTYSDFPEHVFFQIVVSSLLLQVPLTRLRDPRIYLLEEDRRFAEDFFREHGLGQRRVVIVNTQSVQRGSNPDWGIEKYARVANDLANRGVDVLINGGSEGQLREWESLAHSLRRGVVLLKNASPRELAAVITKCDLYIGAPNGPACLALAVGTRTMILVGPGEHGYPGQERVGPAWWPRNARHRFLSKIDWCHATMQCNCRLETWRPLRHAMKHLGVWKNWKKLRKGVMNSLVTRQRSKVLHPCLEAITVEEVVEVAKEQLGGVPKTEFV